MKDVTAKLGNMRKPQDFSVLPSKEGEPIIVQSDRSIGSFDRDTRKGVLNTKGCYFPHLSPSCGAVAYEFPEEFVKACLEQIPKSGDEIGPGVYIG